MDYSVPTISIVFMTAAALTGIAIPVVLFLLFRKKYQADVAPFFVGCAVFIIFALLLERFLHSFILTSGVGKAIKSNIWFYGIYGGLMAGLFEETGRLAAFKTVLKKKRSNDGNALMYGAGHGGIEAFYILVFGMTTNIVMAVRLNTGTAQQLTVGITDAAKLQQLQAIFAALAGTAPAAFLLGIAERIAAVTLHISLSVLVWFAAKNGGKCFWLYPLALLLHAAVDAAAVILSRYVPSVGVILAVVYVLSACCGVIAIAVWKKYAAKSGTMTQSSAGWTMEGV